MANNTINQVEYTVYSYGDITSENIEYHGNTEDIFKQGNMHLSNCLKNCDEESRVKIKNALYENLLTSVLDRINKSIEENNGIVVGCSEITREKNKGKIYVADPKSNNRISGVIGAVSCEIDKLDLYYDNKKYQLVKRTQVKVKFESHIDKSRNGEKLYFAANLLTYGEFSSLSNNNVDCDDNNLFDFLLVDLLTRKLDVARYKGIYRTYRQFESNDENLKGSIDVSRHIKLNAGLKNGRIASKYRENTANNFLNILLIKTYQYIKRKYPELIEKKIDNNLELRGLINQLQNEVEGGNISTSMIISRNMKPISHPYYHEYEDVRKICLKILRSEGVSIFETSNDNVSGFVYYLPDLWENCCLDILKRTIKNQCDGIYSITDQETIPFISKRDGKYGFCESRPDFVIREYDSEKVCMILDAKAKPKWYKVLMVDYVKYFQDDYGEDINKCIRDMVVFGAKKTGVVFPVERKEISKLLELIFPVEDKNDDSFNYDEYIESLKGAYKEAYSNENIVYKRKISDQNDYEFCIIPFIIPESENHSNFSSWKREYNISKEMLCETIGEKNLKLFTR